jgi:hypothetical protein
MATGAQIDRYALNYVYWKAKMSPYPDNQEFGISAYEAGLARRRMDTLVGNIRVAAIVEEKTRARKKAAAAAAAS